MNDARRSQERTDLEDACARRTDRHHYLGVDGVGRDHYHDALLAGGTAWAVDHGEIVHIERDTDARRWVAHVADPEVAGWQDCRYSDASLAELAAAELSAEAPDQPEHTPAHEHDTCLGVGAEA